MPRGFLAFDLQRNVTFIFCEKFACQSLAGCILNVQITEIGNEEFRVGSAFTPENFEDDFVSGVKARRQPGNGFPDPLQGQSHLADLFFLDMIASG